MAMHVYYPGVSKVLERVPSGSFLSQSIINVLPDSIFYFADINTLSQLTASGVRVWSSISSSYVGPGTNNYFPVWKSGGTLTESSSIYQSSSFTAVGINTQSPSASLHISGSSFIDIGGGGGSSNYVLQVNKQNSTYMQIRGDGRIGFGALPSVNGFVQVTSPATNVSHFSLTSGITNSNGSGFYTFRGWWGVYFNDPTFNSNNPVQGYVQVFY